MPKMTTSLLSLLFLWMSCCCARADCQAETSSEKLIAAVHRRDLGAARSLLKSGASANTVDETDQTVLMAAAGNADIPMCRLLIQNGARLNRKNGNGWTALTACFAGISTIWQARYCPFERNYFETIRWLVGHGANINTHSPKYGSLLELSFEKLYDWKPMLEFLLRHGALLPEGTQYSSRTMERAIVDRKLWIVHMLLRLNSKRWEKGEALIAAVGAGTYLNHWGTPIRDHGRPSLYVNVEAVRLLLDAGADANARDWRDYSALQWAVYSGHQSVVRLLLRHGANVNFRHPGDGFTPLSTANWLQDKSMAALLVKEGGKE